jgi:hypothetical protein
MTQDATTTSQRVAARIAGSALLLIIVSGVVGTIVGRDHIEIAGDAVATAQNILAHQTRFRIGTAFEIVMLNCDVVLAVALYILLKPVNVALALLVAFWRLGNAIVLGVSVAFSLGAPDFLGGAHYLKVFNAEQLQAQAKFFLDMHEPASLVGLVFFSLGAAVHSYLLLKSAYIPRILAGIYLFGAVWLLFCCFGFIIAPDSMTVFNTAFIVPDFVKGYLPLQTGPVLLWVGLPQCVWNARDVPGQVQRSLLCVQRPMRSQPRPMRPSSRPGLTFLQLRVSW